VNIDLLTYPFCSISIRVGLVGSSRRVSEFEVSFGFLTRQIKSVHKDLLAFQEKTEQRFDKLDGRFDRIDGCLGKADGRLNRLEKSVRDLRHDMPGIIGNAMRDALRDRRGK
jgi:hypothetical protein